MPQSLQTRRRVLGQLIQLVRRKPHQECCGLVAGRDGVITRAFPAANVAVDPKRNYEIAPSEIVRLMREMRARNLAFLGIYHSHPITENIPSPRDIELAYYSEAAYVIVSPRPYAEKPVRAFSIRDGQATELEIEIV
jgi:[CysO sulfur-carrier protein]-S-L-cysteine hydrolase